MFTYLVYQWDGYPSTQKLEYLYSNVREFLSVIVGVQFTIALDTPSQPIVSGDHILSHGATTTFKLRKVTLENTFVNHVTSLTFQTARVTVKLLTELTEVIVATYTGPLNKTITPAMAIAVRNSSPSLAYVGTEVAFLFNVSQDCCKSVAV